MSIPWPEHGSAPHTQQTCTLTLPATLVFSVGERATVHMHMDGWRGDDVMAGFCWDTVVQATLAVTLFGVTVYDLLHAGVPTITVAHTRENDEGGRVLEDVTDGATLHAGYLPMVQGKNLRQLIQHVWNDRDYGWACVTRAALWWTVRGHEIGRAHV